MENNKIPRNCKDCYYWSQCKDVNEREDVCMCPKHETLVVMSKGWCMEFRRNLSMHNTLDEILGIENGKYGI